MRKAMWKKGLSVAMAAAMLTGTVTVPAVFNTSAIVKAAEVAEKSMPATPKAIDGMVYATVNMEYADFFYGELNNIAAGNETTPDLSNDKVASYRVLNRDAPIRPAISQKNAYIMRNFVLTDRIPFTTCLRLFARTEIKIDCPLTVCSTKAASRYSGTPLVISISRNGNT